MRPDEDGAIDVAGLEVALHACLLAGCLGHQQHELDVTGDELVADPDEQAPEEGVREQPAGRLHDHHADRVAPAGHQASGRPVRNVAELDDGLRTAARASGLTLELSLATRDAVARETPASRATSSIVAAAPRLSPGADVESPSALHRTRGDAANDVALHDTKNMAIGGAIIRTAAAMTGQSLP